MRRARTVAIMALARGLWLALAVTAPRFVLADPAAPAAGADPAVPPPAAETAQSADLAQAGADLERGEALLDAKKGPKRLAQAEAAFTAVVDRLEPGADALDAQGRLVLARALDDRARTGLLRGRDKAADADFARLVALDPAYVLDPARASRKAIERFGKIRATRVGFITLKADPPDADITWNGRVLGAASRLPVELVVLAGPYTLHARRGCYEEKEITGDVAAGEKKTVVLTLDPFARVVRFETSPAGLDIDIDGTFAGTTVRGAPPADSGASSPESGVLELACLAAGDHAYTVHADCYAEVRGTLTVEIDLLDKSPLLVPVIAPRRLETRLSVTSDTPGAVLVLDGKPAGPLPVRDLVLCPRRLKMDARVGDRVVWSETRDLEDGPLELTARRRPTLTLALAGLVPRDDPGHEAPALGEPFASALRKRAGALASFNVDETLPADLRLEARLRDQPSAGAAIELRLVSVALPQYAYSTLCIDSGSNEEAPCYDRFFAEIDAPWTPANGERAGAGSSGGAGSTSSSPAHLAEISPPGSLPVPLPRVLGATLLDADVLLPGPERNAALLRLASALIGAGDYRQALDRALERPGWAEGVTGAASSGTAALLAGICHQALGEEPAARGAFRRAASDPTATLWKPDGVPVAPLARIELAAPSAK